MCQRTMIRQTTDGTDHDLNCFGHGIYAPQTSKYHQNIAKLLTYPSTSVMSSYSHTNGFYSRPLLTHTHIYIHIYIYIYIGRMWVCVSGFLGGVDIPESLSGIVLPNFLNLKKKKKKKRIINYFSLKKNSETRFSGERTKKSCQTGSSRLRMRLSVICNLKWNLSPKMSSFLSSFLFFL